jgi:DNA-binding LacI/PurR family transcriptional regulator
MATIQDVARKAGVSTATVSHVVNHTRTVLPDTRRAVEQAVRELNYRPSAVARGLQTNITHTVGVLVADITSYFFAQIVRELEAAFEPQHYNLMVCNTDEQPERERRYLEMLYDKRVDGVIMVPTGIKQPILQQFTKNSVPVVSMHRRPGTPCGPAVLSDDVAAGYAATEYLIKLGHRRIGVLARGRHLSPVVQRVDGYKSALKAHGIPIDKRIIEISQLDLTTDTVSKTAKRLFSVKPAVTAVVAMSLTSSMGLLKAMRELNVTYPDPVSVVGIGDAPWMELLPAPLTVMAASVPEMCKAAFDLTLHGISANRRRSHTEHEDAPATDGKGETGRRPKTQPAWPEVLVPARLIERNSCRPV